MQTRLLGSTFVNAMGNCTCYYVIRCKTFYSQLNCSHYERFEIFLPFNMLINIVIVKCDQTIHIYRAEHSISPRNDHSCHFD